MSSGRVVSIADEQQKQRTVQRRKQCEHGAPRHGRVTRLCSQNSSRTQDRPRLSSIESVVDHSIARRSQLIRRTPKFIILG